LAVYRQDRLNSGRFLPFFQGSTFRGRRMTSNILSTGFPAGFTDLAASRVVAAKAAGSPPRNAARQTPPSAIRCTCYQCQAAAAAPAGAVAAGAAAPVNYTDVIRKSGCKGADALVAGGNRWFHQAVRPGVLM